MVVGECRTITLEMLERAVDLVLGGAKLIGTNMDPNCPTQHGTRPGCGATLAYLEAATGKKAFCLGKPSPVMLRMARKELMLSTSQTIMVGDTMETDILGGVQMGYQTVLVLSGGTCLEDLDNFAYCPGLVIDSVAELADRTRELEEIFPPIISRPTTRRTICRSGSRRTRKRNHESNESHE